MLLFGALLAGCNAPEPPPGTGGTDVPPGACGRGLVVVETDYQSTNVSLVGVDGSVLSSSFVSSATTATGLSAPLSGDVVVPTMPQSGDELVLLDRYPAGVLTWLDVASAEVRGQLGVGTGFASNPQDVVVVGSERAYVSRFERNPEPGREAWDEGSDLLLVDPTRLAIVGRVELAGALAGEPAGMLPRPNRMVLVGDWLLVLLSPYTADFLESATSRLALVDVRTDALVGTVMLPDLYGCSGLALSPAGTTLAVSCSGRFQGTSNPTVEDAGLVLLAAPDAAQIADGQDPASTMVELGRWSASELVGQPLGFAVDFADEQRLLLTAFGRFAEGAEPAVQDAALELERTTGATRTLVQSEALPFSLGEVRCVGSCGRCFLADAERSVLHELVLGEDGLEVTRAITVDTAVGLPPRLVGRF
jgi:hypothetical protein